MDSIYNGIRQRMSLREPLAEALEVVTRLVDKLTLKKPEDTDKYSDYLKEQLKLAQEVSPSCASFERKFPSFAFSIATGIGKTRLMGACIAYLYLKKGIKHFFVLAPNLTLYEKLKRDFGDPSYEKYVFKGIAEFAANPPIVVDGENYNNFHGHGDNLFHAVEINIFNISKFNTDSKEGKRGTPRMRRLSEFLGESYFDYLAGLDDLVILMDEAHRYRADASRKAIDELMPILGLEMTATPTDEKQKPFKNIVYEYNLAQALADGKYVKIPTVAKRKNFRKDGLSDKELDMLKIEDAISIHEQTKTHLELYSRQNNAPLIKPFILIICRNIAHARETLDLIENEMYDGKYKGKVLQIDSSTSNDDEVDRLFVSLEKPDNRIEIVIHVNKLKEGWDVTNLYTIVPLRAADAPVLVEQSIGRGLRLPFGGKRTGYEDIDKLTVIAHENFEAVIERAHDPGSVLNKFSFIELEDDELTAESSRVVTAQTIFDKQEEQALQAAKTEIEKRSAKETADAKRAVWKVISEIPRLMGATISRENPIKTIKDLDKPEIIEAIKEMTKQEIQKSAAIANPMFAEEEAAPLLEEVNNVVELVIHDCINNVIEIPRMTIQQEAYKSEYKWFDLDTRMGFDLPSIKAEIIRVGLVDKSVETITVTSGRTYEPPRDQIVSALLDYDEIDYDENSGLIYHLTDQAIEAIKANSDPDEDIAQIVSSFKKAIASMIYDQMKAHFVITPLGYTKPKILPFTGIVEQNLIEVEGYGRIDYRDPVQAKYVKKFIYTGFVKSFYTQCKFDSTTELDFANVLESDPNVLRWLRPARQQFNIYWSNGSKRYEPDFVVETEDCIYLVETKAEKEVSAEDVQGKKRAAEEYCTNATEYTTKVGGKPWKYLLLPHTAIDRTSTFAYLRALSC